MCFSIFVSAQFPNGLQQQDSLPVPIAHSVDGCSAAFSRCPIVFVQAITFIGALDRVLANTCRSLSPLQGLLHFHSIACLCCCGLHRAIISAIKLSHPQLLHACISWDYWDAQKM